MSKKTNTKPKAKTGAKTNVARQDNKNAPKAKKTPATPIVEEVIEAAVVTEDSEMSALVAELDEDAIDVSVLDASEIETVTPIDREEVYAGMESELSVGDTEVEGVAPKSKAKTKKATTKTASDVTAAPRRTIDVERLKAIVGDDEAARLITDAAKLPVKVRDKAVNAVASITSGGTMSGYTKYAIELLRASPDNEVSSKGMIEMFLTRGYKQGTASAQAQQQMVLLDHLGFAKRTGRTIKLVADAPLLTAMAA